MSADQHSAGEQRTYRVRLVLVDAPVPGLAVQFEGKPMTEAQADRIAAEAVGLGIPVAVHRD
ncbi:MAG TPA: hypothetical protein VGS97_14040 [Actinocrinis sp.]|uniref:hypothetical protein n=1 Tax=Actinocrinis sp. TaxID=1920516 RepID=UPI002DDCB216|nr:hypothetical protein [Actinocrinis sp.]HEV2345214.1 hypothetical protein [Actinocrinis sp.]